MFKKSFLFFSMLILASCGTNGVDSENPEQTAEFFQKSLKPDSEVTLTKEEFADGLQDVYEFGENEYLIVTHDKQVQQVNFRNAKKEDVESIIELIEFPETYSITSFLEEETESTEVFTKYEGVGIFLEKKGDLMKEIAGNNPYSLILIYDEDRLEYFTDNYK